MVGVENDDASQNNRKLKKQQKKGKKKRTNPRSVIYIILGVIVLLCPVGLTHYKNVEQHKIAEQYSRDVQQKYTLDQRKSILDDAHRYNDSLPPFGAPDPWVTGIDVNSPGYKDYIKQLNVGSVMARVTVPSVGIDLPVYHGTSTGTLAHGIGHLYGTALPVGGPGTHAVLTGHTGLATLTMFDNLTHMKKGEIIQVDVMGEKLAYKVYDIQTVLPQEIENIKPEPGRDLITLVTCTPYGINTHRLLVHAERTTLPEGAISQDYRSPWQPWMIASLIISILALLYLIWWLRRRKKNNEDEDNRED